MKYSTTVITLLAGAAVFGLALAGSLLASTDRVATLGDYPLSQAVLADVGEGYTGEDVQPAGDQPGQKGALAGEGQERVEYRESPMPEGEQDKIPVRKVVESKREKRAFRIKMWIRGLRGDKKRIHSEYGYPSGRYREEVMGEVTETWVYAEEQKKFTFKGNNLIRED